MNGSPPDIAVATKPSLSGLRIEALEVVEGDVLAVVVAPQAAGAVAHAAVGDEVADDERAPIPVLSCFEGFAQHPLQSLLRRHTPLSHRRAPFRMYRCGLLVPVSSATTARSNTPATTR